MKKKINLQKKKRTEAWFAFISFRFYSCLFSMVAQHVISSKSITSNQGNLKLNLQIEHSKIQDIKHRGTRSQNKAAKKTMRFDILED